MNDLVEVFREEVEANLKEATRLALACEQRTPARPEIEGMMRVFHTLKGAARAIGFDQERGIAHRLEDVFHDLLDGKAPFRPPLVDLSLLAIDLIRDTLSARLAGGDLPDPAAFEAQVETYQSADAASSTTLDETGFDGGLDLPAIFRDEVEAQVAAARALLQHWNPGAGNAAADADLRRVFHTLKGAARAMGCDPIRELAGALEDLVHEARNGQSLPPTAAVAHADLLAAIICGLGWIESQLDAVVAGGEPPPVTGFLEQLAHLGEAGAPAPGAAPARGAGPVVPSDTLGAAPDTQPGRVAPDAANPAWGEAPAPTPATPARRSTDAFPAAAGEALPAAPQRARLAYEQLDRLHRVSGELTVAVASLAGERFQQRALSRELTRAGAQLGRLVTTAMGAEPDLESMQQALRQGAQRLGAAAAAMDRLTEIHDRMEGRLRHLSDALADQVTQARLVPLSDLLDDYPRLVRDLALELGKRVELSVEGADNRIDRAVLEQLRNPLLHLLRNALDHGLEPAAVRIGRGKPETGRLTVEAHQLGSMMRIRVADDGAGIDQERLAAAVIAAGHTTADRWTHLDVDERMQFLFLPGLSTAAAVSATSGRGFGLDIVKAGIESTGGTVGVQSEPGQGTCFELHVPLSLSLTRCLLVIGGRHPLFGDQRYAFPMGEVARVQRLAPTDLREIEGRMAVHLEGETLPVFELHAILGLAPIQQDLGRKHLLVLGDGDGRRGLLVEAVVDEQDMVARPVDERLGKVAEVSGLTLLEDGGLALILDVPDLLLHMREGTGQLRRTGPRRAAAPVAGLTPLHGVAAEPLPEAPASAQVLVVEDSVTVREVERHFLEQAGYRVTTAVNGVDGLNKAKAGDHQILITDIDMPRMNGIELIRTLRGIDRFRRLPIVVVSYKDRAEDRDRALEAGADRYVTKSEFDTDAMLALVAQLLASAGTAGDGATGGPREHPSAGAEMGAIQTDVPD